MSMNRGSRAIDQHYVPAGYLRGFVPDSEEALFVLRRAPAKWFRERPENIATKRNFYSVLRQGVWDDRLETFLGRSVEGPGLKALRRFNRTQDIISVVDRQRISLLLGMQYLRIPRFREDLERTLETFLQLYAERAFENVPKIRRDLENVEGMATEKAAATAREIQRLQRTGGITIKVRPEAGLFYMFGLLGDVSRIFYGMDWTVTTADNPVFFTSDNPVHIVPSSLRKKHVALADPRTVLHVPLSSRRFLTMSKYGEHSRRVDTAHRAMCGYLFTNMAELPPVINYIHSDTEMIHSFNSITCRTALEWVSGPFKSDFINDEMQEPISKLSFELQVSRAGINVQQIIETEEST